MDRKEETWVLGIAGLTGSVLLTQGQWGLLDSLIGIIILVVLGAARGVGNHSRGFVRAYGALYALGLIVIVSPLTLLFLYITKLANKPIIHIGPLAPPFEGAEPFNFVIDPMNFLTFVLWLMLWFIVHYRIKSWVDSE